MFKVTFAFENGSKVEVFANAGDNLLEGGVWIINQKISTLSAGSYTVGARVTNKKRF